jgi:O-antigen ligase
MWPHNVYLFYANTVGIVGLGFFLWMLWRLWRMSKPQHDDLFHASFASGFMVMGHAMLFVFLIDEIKIDYLRNSIYQFQVWVFFAMIAAAHRVAQKDAAAARPPRLVPVRAA